MGPIHLILISHFVQFYNGIMTVYIGDNWYFIRELKLQNMNFRTHKNKTSTSKTEQVIGVLVSRVMAKSQFCQ